MSATGYLKKRFPHFINVTNLELTAKSAAVNNSGQVVTNFKEELVKKKNKYIIKRKKQLAKLCSSIEYFLSFYPRSHAICCFIMYRLLFFVLNLLLFYYFVVYLLLFFTLDLLLFHYFVMFLLMFFILDPGLFFYLVICLFQLNLQLFFCFLIVLFLVIEFQLFYYCF